MMQAGQQSKRMISALEHIVYILNIEQDTVLKNGLNLFIKFTLYKTVPSEYWHFGFKCSQHMQL